jgi:hypothetical protein
MSLPSRRRSRGFGLLEIIVLLGIASVIGVLSAVALEQANQLQRIHETWEILERTRLALVNAAGAPPAFRQTVGANPGELSDLVVSLGTAGVNSCGNGFTGAQRNNWIGPYGGFTIDSTVGLPTPIGIGGNQLVRNPANAAVGTLAIVIPSVDSADAALLDDVYDNSDDAASGTVQWTPPVGGVTTLSYLIPIDNKC